MASDMAASDMASDSDYLREHQRTWAAFTKFITWGLIIVAIVLIGMALFLL
jgi:hypothetical protein